MEYTTKDISSIFEEISTSAVSGHSPPTTSLTASYGIPLLWTSGGWYNEDTVIWEDPVWPD